MKMVNTNNFQPNKHADTLQQPSLSNQQWHLSTLNTGSSANAASSLGDDQIGDQIDHSIAPELQQYENSTSFMNSQQNGLGPVPQFPNMPMINTSNSSSAINTNNLMLPQNIVNSPRMDGMGSLNSVNQTAMNIMPNIVPQAQSNQASWAPQVPNVASRGNQQVPGLSSSPEFERVDFGQSIAFRNPSPPMSSFHGKGSNFPEQKVGKNKLHPQQQWNSDCFQSSASSMNNFNSLGIMNQMNSFAGGFPNNDPNSGFGMPASRNTGMLNSMPVSSANNTSMLNSTQLRQMLEPQDVNQTFSSPSEDEDPVWEQQFKALRAYRLHTGNCRVPARYKANPKLGHWVMTQRRQYTLLKHNMPSALTADRIRKLEALGFAWAVRPEPVASWNERLIQLTAYKATYGNCLVPQRYPKLPQLGTWVHTQRRQYKLLCEGKKSSMTKEKIQALNDLGFDWDAKHISPNDHKRQKIKVSIGSL